MHDDFANDNRLPTYSLLDLAVGCILRTEGSRISAGQVQVYYSSDSERQQGWYIAGDTSVECSSRRQLEDVDCVE